MHGRVSGETLSTYSPLNLDPVTDPPADEPAVLLLLPSILGKVLDFIFRAVRILLISASSSVFRFASSARIFRISRFFRLSSFAFCASLRQMMGGK